MAFEATDRSRPGWRTLFLLCRWFSYLVLSGFVVWQLSAAGFKAVEFLRSSATSSAGACQLDSFSQPSIALAILKQQAERSLGAYLLGRQQIVEINLAQEHVPAAKRQASEEDRLPLTGFEVASPETSAISELETLETQVQELNTDLDRKLMLVYFQNRLWSQFLDRYLHLLHTEPQNAMIVNWAWSALTCSQMCERNEEVVDEFEQLIRLHRELKSTRGLKATLDDWRTEHPRSSTSMDSPVDSAPSGNTRAPIPSEYQERPSGSEKPESPETGFHLGHP